MSGLALIWAANVKGLKPHAKIVLIQLADFHNKETGRCFPSAARLAGECEMDRATVFRHMKTLVEKGLISRHSRGDGKGGRGSNEYELHLDIVLGPSAAHKEKSLCATTPLVAESHYPSGSAATRVVAQSDCNLNNEPGIEPKKDAREELLSILSPEMADAYISHRKVKRAKLTPHAAQLIARKLSEHPNPDAVVELSIMNGWTGVFPEKGNQNERTRQNNSYSVADEIADAARAR